MNEQTFHLYNLTSLNIGRYNDFLGISNNAFGDCMFVPHDAARLSASLLYNEKGDKYYILIAGEDHKMQAERLSREFGFVLGRKREVRSLKGLDKILS